MKTFQETGKVNVMLLRKTFNLQGNNITLISFDTWTQVQVCDAGMYPGVGFPASQNSMDYPTNLNSNDKSFIPTSKYLHSNSSIIQ